MHPIVWIIGVYGVFTLTGGVIGFLKAGSAASLLAGGTSGIVLLVCAYAAARGARAALLVSLAVALILGVRFLGTWFQHHRLMPDLIMIILSAVTLISVLAVLIKR